MTGRDPSNPRAARNAIPDDYRQTLANGVEALNWAAETLRNQKSRSDEKEILLVQLRDVVGLAGRLADTDDEEWSSRTARFFFSPADLYVLRHWEDTVLEMTPKGVKEPFVESRMRYGQFRMLRALLEAVLAP